MTFRTIDNAIAHHSEYVRRVQSHTQSALVEINRVLKEITYALDETQPDHRSTPVVTALQAACCDAAATRESLEATIRRLESYLTDTIVAHTRQEA